MEIGGITLDQVGAPAAGAAPDRGLELPAGSPGEQLQALLDADFEFQLRDNPEFSSQAGFHEHDGELQDLSPGSWDVRLAHTAQVLAKLAELDLSSSEVSEKQRLHAKLLQAAVAEETRAIEQGCHLLPLNSTGVGGVHENFLEVLDWMPFESEEDFKHYLDRLMAFPVQVQGAQDLLAYGACMRGMAASQSMMRRVPERLKELIDSDLPQLKAPLDGKEVDAELSQQILQAFDSCFKGSLRGLLNFLEEFYSERVREDPACKALRNGEEVYAQCLRFHATATKTVQEMHDAGLTEVARIEARIQHEVLDALGFKGTLREFAEGLRQDPAFFYSTGEELMEAYSELVKQVQGKLPEIVSKLPKMQLQVVKKLTGPYTSYSRGTADGKRPARFAVNVARLNEQAKYELPAVVLRCIAGHHLQLALAQENAELPSFLRHVESRRYEFAPARRPLYTAYSEGWALYCERLGEALGMYSTPHELFGRLSMEMMRAVGLVVDTGIHQFGWSVEKACTYMEEKTGMSASRCAEECHRSAAWPGHACSYKVGETAIEAMRSGAEEQLGAGFDLRSFHDVILGTGPLPLDILEQRVAAWASEGRAKSS